jgi:quercetin dioxygenase-like cupin family protein
MRLRPSRSIACFLALSLLLSGAGIVRAGAGPTACSESDTSRIAVEHLGAQSAGPDQALWLLRLTFDPGASLPFRTNLGPTTAYVEAGAIAFTAVAGTARLHRAADAADATLTLGAESRLSAGDALFYGPDVEHLVRNPSAAPSSLLLSTLAPADSPPYATAVTVNSTPVCTLRTHDDP